MPEKSATSESKIHSVDREVASETAPVDSQFVRWFSHEADHIEDRNENALATEEELKRQVSGLTPEEVAYLANRVSSSTAPASERILASYLLGLAAEVSSQALVDIASQPEVNPGAHPVHSVDEARSVQDRSYKIMAVDAIFNSSTEVNRKLSQLESIVNQTPDMTIKRYASDKIDDLRDTF